MPRSAFSSSNSICWMVVDMGCEARPRLALSRCLLPRSPEPRSGAVQLFHETFFTVGRISI